MDGSKYVYANELNKVLDSKFENDCRYQLSQKMKQFITREQFIRVFHSTTPKNNNTAISFFLKVNRHTNISIQAAAIRHFLALKQIQVVDVHFRFIVAKRAISRTTTVIHQHLFLPVVLGVRHNSRKVLVSLLSKVLSFEIIQVYNKNLILW